MHFTTKFIATLSALLATAHASDISARAPDAQPSVIFFDDVNFTGSAYSSNNLVPALCSTLPGNWLGRAESVMIGTGYSCTFFAVPGCEGTGSALSGNVAQLQPSLYNAVESFFCSKAL